MKSDPELFQKLEHLLTEQRNPRTRFIDSSNSYEIVKIINEEDKHVAHCVEMRLEVIAAAIDTIVEQLKVGGRLLYFGAGTSGRLGVLDAAECPPTFGTDPDTVKGFIAGGERAMFVAQEGAEDKEENGFAELERIHVEPKDVIVGIAASGRTPYVHGILKGAKKLGCPTILITTVSADQVDIDVDFMIDVPVGPEVIMGSTRMKSATAQKMILNMLSTGAMIRLGKVYENVMVDLQLTNKKLEERAKKIVMMLANVNYKEAGRWLEKANTHVKTALVMAIGGLSYEKATMKLKENNGFIRKALNKE